MIWSIPLSLRRMRAGVLALAVLAAGCAPERPPKILKVEMAPAGPIAHVAADEPFTLDVRGADGSASVVHSAERGPNVKVALGAQPPGSSMTVQPLARSGEPAGPLTAFRHDPMLVARASARRVLDGIAVRVSTVRIARVRLLLRSGDATATVGATTADGLEHAATIPESGLPVSSSPRLAIAPEGAPEREEPLPDAARRELLCAHAEWLAPKVAALARGIAGGGRSAGMLDRLDSLADAVGSTSPERAALDGKLRALEPRLPPRWLLAELRALAAPRADPEVPLPVRSLVAAMDVDLGFLASSLATRGIARGFDGQALTATALESHYGPGFGFPVKLAGMDGGRDVGFFAHQEALEDAQNTGRAGVQRTLVATGTVELDEVDPLWEAELSGVFKVRATGSLEVTVNDHPIGSFRPPGTLVKDQPLYLAFDSRVLVRGRNTFVIRARPLPGPLEHREIERGIGLRSPGLVLWLRL